MEVDKLKTKCATLEEYSKDVATGREPPKETELQAAEETEDSDSSEESEGESGEDPLDLLPAISNIRLRSDSEEAIRDAQQSPRRKVCHR